MRHGREGIGPLQERRWRRPQRAQRQGSGGHILGSVSVTVLAGSRPSGDCGRTVTGRARYIQLLCNDLKGKTCFRNTRFVCRQAQIYCSYCSTRGQVHTSPEHQSTFLWEFICWPRHWRFKSLNTHRIDTSEFGVSYFYFAEWVLTIFKWITSVPTLAELIPPRYSSWYAFACNAARHVNACTMRSPATLQVNWNSRYALDSSWKKRAQVSSFKIVLLLRVQFQVRKLCVNWNALDYRWNVGSQWMRRYCAKWTSFSS